MLMAHSVEGRFPFLDDDVVELANSLPDACKLRILDEKHVLKRVTQSQAPSEIVTRKSSPTGPPTRSASSTGMPPYVDEALSSASVRAANIFDPVAVERLRAKCQAHAHAGDGDLSNFDNMALVGVLSTQLLFQQFVADRPEAPRRLELSVDVDHQDVPGVYA
ncbi:asparagine synthase-related protein [Bradyrhizobium japonicum]